MKISEAIKELTEALEEYGDLQIVTRGEHYGEFIYGEFYQGGVKEASETYSFELHDQEDIDAGYVELENPEKVITFE